MSPPSLGLISPKFMCSVDLERVTLSKEERVSGLHVGTRAGGIRVR